MSLFSKKSVVATLVGTVLASVVMTSVAQAQEGPGKRRANGGERNNNGAVAERVAERRATRAFNRIDTSDDSLITLDEFTAKVDTRAERSFNRKDADEDGLLSLEEATTNRRGQSRPDYSDIADEIVACVAELAEEDETIIVPDADHFGSPQDRFDAVDTSADGFLSLEEVQAAALNKATTAFDTMDADASGDVTLEEFKAAGASRRATRQAVRSCIEELDTEDDMG